MPIAQFLVRKAVIFIRQGAQGLGQQPGAFHVDIEIALAAAVQGARGSHNVTQVPAFDGLQSIGVKRLAINVELQAVRTILYEQKRASVAHQSTRDREHPVALFQIFLAGLGKFCLQSGRHGRTPKIIGKRLTRLTQRRQLAPAFCNQFVLVGGACCSGIDLI